MGSPFSTIKSASFFGETHVHFITTPVLDIPDNISREIASERYEIGAVGAWFGRLENYPGGTYLITIFLFPVSPYVGMGEEDYTRIALDAINTIRENKGLRPLKLDKRQSKKANDISRQLKGQQDHPTVSTGKEVSRQVFSYVSEDPGVWPANLDYEIMNPGLSRIGIGISSQENEETRKHTFWITLIF